MSANIAQRLRERANATTALGHHKVDEITRALLIEAADLLDENPSEGRPIRYHGDPDEDIGPFDRAEMSEGYGRASDISGPIPFTERCPLDAQTVSVFCDEWTSPKVMIYRENWNGHGSPRLTCAADGRHYWYPERMSWRPHCGLATTPTGREE